MKLPKGFNTVGPNFYDYQLESFIFCLQQNTAGLLLEMGLGKTRISIDLARYRIQNDGVKKILVVCPTSVIYNWQEEIKKFSEYKTCILHDSKENRIAKASKSNYQFAIINYESLFPLLENLGVITKKNRTYLVSSDTEEIIDKLNFNMVIFDETARFVRNVSTKRTLASILIGDRAKYKLILTGTPIANKPLDVWPQFRIMDGGETLGKDFYAFRGYFFYKDSNMPWAKWMLKRNKIQLLTNKIYSKCIRKKKEDVLKDLPERVFQTIILEMEPALRTIYNNIKKEIIAQIMTSEGLTTLTINNILLRLLRLQQVTAGFSVKNGVEVELEHQPKLEALVEQLGIIIENGDSAIVWCRFLKSISMISERLNHLGIKHTIMSGADNEKEKYAKWKGFQKSKSINVFVGQVESGGVGIELFKLDSERSKTQYSIFFENTYVLDTREQAMARIHRIGQKSTCFYMDLVVRNSIDEVILNSLKKKKNVADAILEKGVKLIEEDM
jgi:SNF2 family DNA or RNA helicase